MMEFHVGQKVVCVNDRWDNGRRRGKGHETMRLPDAMPIALVSILSDSFRLWREGDIVHASLLVQCLHCGSNIVGCGTEVLRGAGSSLGVQIR